MKVHTPIMVPATALNPAHYNPNAMKLEEYQALKDSISAEGFVSPIVVQKNGMHIIAGHHRVRAVRELAIENEERIPEIPCVILDVDDEHAKRLNLKLQHIHGSPDARLLGELLVDIYRERPFDPNDVASLGLNFDEMTKLVRIADPEFLPPPAPEPSLKEFGRSITLSVEFSDVETRDRVKKLLVERASIEKAKPGDVIGKLLTAPSKKSKSVPPPSV